MCVTHPIAMNSVVFANVLVAEKVGRRSSVLRAQTPLGYLNLKTFLKTVRRRYATPVWCVR